MGNEFGAADMQPHLVYGMIIHEKYDATAVTATTVIEGGYHQKMRLRRAWMMVVDADLSIADVDVNVYHGGNLVVEAHESGAAGSPIGAISEMTVVDQYKDLEADDALVIQNTRASTTGDVFFTFEYELVE